jgi:cbb3-type cytochrome oxidase subunit 3
MIKDILTRIEGVEIYPIISLLIFFLFFVGIGIYLFRMDKSFVNKMKQLPLNDNIQNLNSGEVNEKNN